MAAYRIQSFFRLRVLKLYKGFFGVKVRVPSVVGYVSIVVYENMTIAHVEGLRARLAQILTSRRKHSWS